MTTIRIHDGTLTVSFTTIEKVAGLVRDQHIPLAAIRAVEVVPDGIAATSGVRAPGLALPGHRMVGTWRSRTGKALMAVHGRGPAVRITLDGQQHYTSLLISHDDADTLATSLHTHTS